MARKIVNFRLQPAQILDRIGSAPAIFHIKAFEIRRPSFVNPHVRRVGGGNAVAEPLMAALVNDDEVESHADADAGPVAPQVAVLEKVAVGHRALVLHPRVRRLHQLVPIFGKRILAEVVLKRLDHPPRLRKLHLRFIQILGQHIEIQRQIAELDRQSAHSRQCSATHRSC